MASYMQLRKLDHLKARWLIKKRLFYKSGELLGILPLAYIIMMSQG